MKKPGEWNGHPMPVPLYGPPPAFPGVRKPKPRKPGKPKPKEK